MTSRRNKTDPKHRGFTLLELILVMIIMCTVLAMAAPSLRGFFSSRKIADVAEQILALTHYAKTQSVYQSGYYRLNFEPTQREYWLSSLDKGQFQRLKSDFGSKFTIPGDIEIDFENFDRQGSLYYIDFRPEGYSRQCRILLEDDKENYIDVVCYGPAENFEVIERFEDNNDQRK